MNRKPLKAVAPSYDANGYATGTPTGFRELEPTDTFSAVHIAEDTTHRFATDTEKTSWNNKESGGAVVSHASATDPHGDRAYTDSRIATVMGAAPAALDTLNELAAALGNDANFAASMTTALAGKQPIGSYAPTAHTHTKSDVGLANCDNTSDISKPISTATQTALNGKETSGAAAAAQSFSVQRSNHTGTQAWSTLTGTPTTLAGYGITDAPAQPVAQLIVPTTGQTQTFNVLKKDELIACNHVATIAAQTFVFPSDANSQTGQELRIFSRSIITAVTLTTTGLTILGAALTTMAANSNACWKKVAASTWARVQ